LSLLTGAEPRGLPGTRIDRIKFQRAAEGHPLDDIVVDAHDARGQAVCLEIQVKRSVTFTPSDAVFQGIVAQIAEAARRRDFWNRRHELAIATARTSRKIDGAYQDVLRWARELESGTAFAERIARPGSANDDMRTFVQTFRSNLRTVGVSDDDETVCRFLRRLQILMFDFSQLGSASEELARERAARALHPDEMVRAASLWTSLIELALRIAASGGARNRKELIENLRERSFRLVGERHFSSARAAVGKSLIVIQRVEQYQ
jgi:hypothetical protein